MKVGVTMGKSILKPEWVKVKAYDHKAISRLHTDLKSRILHTVCEEANCPNRSECFSSGTATFMILGFICTRHCRFCNVSGGEPLQPDLKEPERLAQAVRAMQLKHVVITSVTRDDLPDGGAGQFAACVEAIRELEEDVTVELLIPDLHGNFKALETILRAKPDVLNHNIETVLRLYPKVRPEANYEGSLALLHYVRKQSPDIRTKSGIMVGLGETEEEMVKVFEDLRQAGCDYLTIGQYLRPTKAHLEVVDYIHPEQFKNYEYLAYRLGFRHVASGPLVRSSYHASQAFQS